MEKLRFALRLFAIAVGLVVFVILFECAMALTAQADTITDNVAATITQDSVLPLAPGVSLELAQNLMTAQADSTYAANEPDSLTLSVAAVLRAISLEVWPGGPTEITNAVDTPYPFIESTIAIDDRAAVSFYVNGVLWQPGDVINFGDVPIVTPEPESFILLLSGLVGLLIVYRRELRRHQ